MTTEPEENVTDASPNQTEPDTEPGVEGAPQNGAGADGGPDAQRDGAPKSPRWSERQPEPAPWYVGRPGAAPPPAGPAGWGVAATPPGPGAPGQPGAWPAPPQGTYGQSPYGPHAPGRQGGPVNGSADGAAADESQGPATPGTPSDASDAEQSKTPEAPIAPPQQHPYGQPPTPPPPAPWHDPNRYGQPQRGPGRPQQQDDPFQHRQRPQQPAQEDQPRPPLDLRTRWARGLALGSITCTLASIWYSVTNFPTWMVGAGAGLVLGLVGLWMGVFAQRAAAAKGKRAPIAVGAIVWSSIATLLSLMILAFSLIFYTQLSQLSDCMRSATTISAQNQCETSFQNEFGVPR